MAGAFGFEPNLAFCCIIKGLKKLTVLVLTGEVRAYRVEIYFSNFRQLLHVISSC
jgi:hypothetical protein